MNKFGFIKQLLDHEKFDASQKERFLKLVSNELVAMEGHDIKNAEQIKFIMKELKLDDDNSLFEGDLNYDNGLISFLSKEEENALFNESDNNIKKYKKGGLLEKIIQLKKESQAKSKMEADMVGDEKKEQHGNPIERKYNKGVEDLKNNETDIIEENAETDIEKYVKATAESIEPIYKKKENRKIDPRNASLEEKMFKLSNICSVIGDETSCLESIKIKHNQLNSEAAITAINRIFFIILQKEVLNGEYEKIGIPKTTFIVPENIARELFDIGYNIKGNSKSNTGLDETVHKNLNKYLNPKYLSNFLYEYNQDPILKYTCHEIDADGLVVLLKVLTIENYDFNTHLDAIMSSFKKISNKYYGKIKYMSKMMFTYLTGHNEGGWSQDGIKINWSSIELKNWAKDNPNKVPNPDLSLSYVGFEFMPIEIKTTGENIHLFNNLTIHFKHLFHLRSDNSLKRLLEWYNVKFKINDKCRIGFNDFPINIEFFTDVNKLLQVYDKLIKICVEFSVKNNLNIPEIELNFREDLNFIYLDIHHKNSTYGKSLLSSNRLGEKQTDLINDLLNGLCDLSITADFGNGDYALKSLWPISSECERLDFFEGVKYTLKFYR